MAKGDIRDGDEIVHLKLRLPEHMRKQLADAAEAADRSMNSEIISRLGWSFSPEWQQFISAVEERERKVAQAREEALNELLKDPQFQENLSNRVREKLAEKDAPEPPPSDPLSIRRPFRPSKKP
jgi:hypothetical protein